MDNDDLNKKMVEFDQATNEARRLSMESEPGRQRINELLAKRNQLRREIDTQLKNESRNSIRTVVVDRK